MEFHASLPDSPRAAGAAREAVRAALSQWQLSAGALLDDAVLIASELATNALRYGSAPLEIHLELSDSQLVLAVKDGRPSDLPYPRLLTVTEPSGRGMHIVAATSDRWGWDRGPSSKVVWAEIDLPHE